MNSGQTALYFQFFNEIGIIAQLSRTLMERQLPDGLLNSHFSVLNHLIRVRDGQTQVALASAFQVAKTTIAHTVSGLERHGLVELRDNPEDGRSKCVWITEHGRDFRNNAILAMEPFMEEFAKRFSSDSIETLTGQLSQVRVYLDNNRHESVA